MNKEQLEAFNKDLERRERNYKLKDFPNNYAIQHVSWKKYKPDLINIKTKESV